MIIDKQIILKAENGMVLTNGEVFGRVVYLCKSDSPANWHEITQEEAGRLQQSEVDSDA